MKKVYIQPIMKNGLTIESSLLATSFRSDDGEINMSINNSGAGSDADARRNSFWDETE